ncbi:hypothetical protein DAEQUDRAFT_23800 [Daedalea quercina L-15889]|uniref:Pentatricopeptide repeat-containing protein-mitochondrial domain-containing protein n=1 Tax=Daedalea quercina L-15889 TaxID=1314783 RepID=A0A165UN33_9APHY|nr:hypothetical protein DAEQUDRAFT_23800 [Daedalea quercina L-15889]
MPWRAVQVYGHLRRTALLQVSTPRTVICKSSLVTQPFHQSITSKWPATAAALSVQIPSVGHTRSIEDVGGSTNGSVVDGQPRVPQSDRVPKVRRSRGVREDDPEDPVEEAIDSMFHRLSETGSLPDAQGSSKWAEFQAKLCEPGLVIQLAVRLVKTQKPHRALRVLFLSHMLGCKLRQHGYESVAYQLASTGQWSLVTSLVELARRQSGMTTLRLLNWRARAIVNAQDFAALDRVLDIFEQEQVRPDRRTFRIIISGHLHNRDLARAKRCLAAMEEGGIKVDASTHALIIASYREFGLAHSVKEKALDVLAESDDRSATNIINSLVQQCLDRGDLENAMRYLALFDSNDVPAAGGSSIQQGGDLSPVESPHSQRRSTPPQDAYTFTILINYLATQADLPRALHILERMKESGVQPDSSTAAALVRIHFAAGEVSAAIRIVANMCQARHVPGVLFERLGLTASGSDKPSLLPVGLPPTAEVFNALIRGVLATRGLNGMITALRIMKLCNVFPDETTAHILLLHLDKVERATPRDIMRHFHRLLPYRVIPTVRHLNVMLQSILRRQVNARRQMDRNPAKESSAAEGDEVDISGWDRTPKTTEDTYDPAAGLEIPQWLSYRTQAQPTMRSLVAREIRSDRATYALRLRHDAVIKRDLAMAKQSFQAMINRGLHPNEYHFAAVMEGYAHLGDVDGAEGVMDSALKEGIRPNVKLYTILINACARQKNPGRALRIFRAMLGADVQPDVFAVHAVVQVFLAAEKKTDARRILLQLWPTVADLPEGVDTSGPLSSLLKFLLSLGGKGDKDKKPLSGREARMMRWKVNRIVQRWTGPSSRGF